MNLQLLGEFEPDLLLVMLSIGLNVGHLEELFISGLIQGPLVLLVGLPGEPLTSTGLEGSGASQS
jgi:hypothetical protein